MVVISTECPLLIIIDTLKHCIQSKRKVTPLVNLRDSKLGQKISLGRKSNDSIIIMVENTCQENFKTF
jgi:hypothetical protein